MVLALLDDEHLADRPAAIFGRRLAVWTVLCFIAGAPSFILGLMADADKLAMLAGIVSFVVLLTLIGSTESFNRWKRNPGLRRAIRTAFITRVGLSLMFPFGWALDLFAGFFAISITTGLMNDYGGSNVMIDVDWVGREFLYTFIATLVQGALLLGMLLIYMSLVYALVARTTPVPAHLKSLCTGCGYDLRGCPGAAACPECGASVAAR